MEVTNRFKGLYLIDRVPEELWREVHDIVQEEGIKTIPKKTKCKKAKWVSEEALLIAMKRREAKGKGEKERHTHLNAEFQRTAVEVTNRFKGLDLIERMPEELWTEVHDSVKETGIKNIPKKKKCFCICLFRQNGCLRKP